MIEDIKILSLIISLNIGFLLIGYLFGKITNIQKGSYVSDRPKSFFENQKQKLEDDKSNSISIDDKKVVLEIKTDNLQKKYDSLGDVTTSSENISESINKLKNLKK